MLDTAAARETWAGRNDDNCKKLGRWSPLTTPSARMAEFSAWGNHGQCDRNRSAERGTHYAAGAQPLAPTSSWKMAQQATVTYSFIRNKQGFSAKCPEYHAALFLDFRAFASYSAVEEAQPSWLMVVMKLVRGAGFTRCMAVLAGFARAGGLGLAPSDLHRGRVRGSSGQPLAHLPAAFKGAPELQILKCPCWNPFGHARSCRSTLGT